MSRVPMVTARLVRDRTLEYPGSLRGPADVAKIMLDLFGDSPQETFVVFFLNTRHRIHGLTQATIGTADASLVHPRECFRAAILANASAIIIAHNHPSGSIDPSPEDRKITSQLVEAGKLLGIPVLDHVIVGDDVRWYSFGEHGDL